MRKTIPKRNIPQLGQVTITKFLWFPKTINNETRWLETASFDVRRWKGTTGTIWEDPIRWNDIRSEK